MIVIKNIVLAIIGFSSGIVVAGGIFAFIAIIGVVPRLAQRTKTVKNITCYENSIVAGGIFGCISMVFDISIKIGFLSVIPAAAVGVFVGCIAVSIAEVLDVIPVFMRRARLKNGIQAFVLSIAFGKAAGSLIYFIIPNFCK